MNYNAEFFKTGPCSIAYKGAVIGMTLDSPLLNIEPELYEAKCNQIGGRSIRKIITNSKITVSATVKETDNAFANFLAVNGKITNVVLGKDVLVTGGELSLSPIAGDDNIRYCFPKALLIPETVYAYKNTDDHCLKLAFEVYEDSEGVLLQKISQ